MFENLAFPFSSWSVSPDVHRYDDHVVLLLLERENSQSAVSLAIAPSKLQVFAAMVANASCSLIQLIKSRICRIPHSFSFTNTLYVDLRRVV